jgi:hypothetical protein
MRVPKRKKINIFQERIVFQCGSRPPEVYPPGYFGNGESESHATPPPDYEEDESDEGIPEHYDAGGFEDFRPEEDAYPGFYDSDFDIPQEPEVSNHSLYRLYDVFIHQDSNPLSSQQLYVMHDFKYGENDSIEVIPNRFAVVSLLNVFSPNFSSSSSMAIPLLVHAPYAILTHY